MPELPEVHTIVQELKKEIIDKKIVDIDINVPKMFSGKIKDVKNAKITGITRRAKLIIIKLNNKLNLVIHLKLTGQLFYLKKGEKKTKTGEGIGPFTHIIFNFSDGSHLIFNDLRKFGFVKVLTDEQVEKMSKEEYGPEPLEKEFTLEKFKEILNQNPQAKIKSLLMDQTKIAGIGNIYSDEALFEAKIHPLRKINSLSKKEILALYKAVRKVLEEAIKYKGTSIDTYRRITGEKGTYEFHRKVYRREGEKCYRCKEKIKRIKIAGRSSYFCPVCQRI